MQNTNKKSSVTVQLVLTALFTALIAVGAFIKIPIPYIPFTLQTFFVMLAGIILGQKWGAVSAGLYLALGLIGLPIFTQGGGIGYIFQPTFGYIIGFVVGAFLTGYLANKRKRTFINLLVANLVGLAAIYILGMIYFYLIMNVYLKTPVSVGKTLLSCFLLVIPGDIVLSFLSAFIAKRILPVRDKYFKPFRNTQTA